MLSKIGGSGIIKMSGLVIFDPLNCVQILRTSYQKSGRILIEIFENKYLLKTLIGFKLDEFKI